MITLSILGLYNEEPTLFNNMVAPVGIDRLMITDNILLECAELETLYPDPDFMKMAIGKWSVMMLPTWSRIAAAAAAEYNPIENYDRSESESISSTNSKTDSRTNSGSSANTGTDKIVASGSDTTKVSAYDSNTFVPESSMEYGRTDTTTHGLTTTISGTSSGTESDTGSTNRISRVHGNIGVTTSQQMLESELEIAPKLNVVMHIVDDFKKRFCLLVY